MALSHSLCAFSHESDRRKASVRISSFWASEQKDERLWSVDLIMNPASALLNTEASPFAFGQDSASCHLLIDSLRKDDVTVLVEVVEVLFRIFNFVWKVRHAFEETEDGEEL